jgi:hypothetical protein
MTASALTLALLRDRVEAGLMDSSNRTWDTGTLDEGIKRALADLAAAAGASLAVKDLGGAAATTVDVLDESTLVVGSAAYAARSRAVNRTEKVNLGQEGAAALMRWADAELGLFELKLSQVRQRLLHNSTSAPHSELDWEERPPDF